MSWRHAAKGAAGPADHEDKLAKAYSSVFRDNREDVEMVLTDLAVHCGWYQVEQRGVPPDELQYQAGLRAAFGRLFHFLSLDDASLKALEEAARTEAVQQQEGQF